MSAEAHETTPSARRALVVRGGWPGHQPVETTDAILPFLRSNGFEVRVEDGIAVYADDDYMKTVDLIVQSVTMSTIEGPEIAGLRRAVESGTGLGGWHGGIADSFRNSADYLQLVGGQFASHPGKHPDEHAGDASDNFRPHTITMLPAAAAHPITVGIDDFELVTEQYWVLHDDYNDVLAVTTQDVREFDPWTRPVTSPAVWTRQWGAGRVFVMTPGHSLAVVTNPTVRTLIERGLLWASR
jgi:type 1 glutamine amidotransferase